MRELLPRTVTAIVLIVIVVSLLFISKTFDNPWAIALLAGSVTLLCSMEYAGIIQRFNLKLEKASFVALNVFYISSTIFFEGQFALWFLTLAIVWPLVWYASRRDSFKHTLSAWFGILYIPLLLQFAYQVYELTAGMFYLTFLLGAVWIYDIAAFLAGSIWGREKILPEVSPSKTWEGVLGGVIGVLLLTLSAPYWIPGIGWTWQWVFVALFLSLATQLGDLFESWGKRVAGVKDAGGLLPGHGGVLDRVDGLLFASPVFYFYLQYVLDLV